MRSALSFLTPFGRSSVPTTGTMKWFPAVGLVVGLGVGGLWWGSAHVLPAAVAGAVVVAGDVALTGSLHVDGLTDAADGLLPPLPRARRLEVMRDPSVGAFGAVALVTVLLLRFAVFASVAPSPLLVAALWGGSRTAMAVTTRLVPYARTEGGLASAFGARPSDGQPSDGQPSDDRTPGVPGRQALPGLAAVVLGVAACVALAVLARQVRGFAALSVAAVAFALVVLLARRRIGGFTGDVLGAAGVVGETAGLLVLALRWT